MKLLFLLLCWFFKNKKIFCRYDCYTIIVIVTMCMQFFLFVYYCELTASIEKGERVMGRWAFSHSFFWLQATRTLIVKSFNCFDNGIPIPIFLPPASKATSLSSLVSAQQEQQLPLFSSSQNVLEGTYRTFRRSAYSVLRSRNTLLGVCAQNLFLAEEVSATSKKGRCCCAALLYRVSEKDNVWCSFASDFVDRYRERDDFVFSLKLASVEQLLREVAGEAKYEALVGPALTQADWVGLCEELQQLSDDTLDTGANSTWVARLLLTSEEEHRVKWLREEGGLSSTAFARAHSFRAMYVAYNIGDKKPVDVYQLQAIERHMIENNIEWDMCDVAVVSFFAMEHKWLEQYFCHVVTNVLLAQRSDSGSAESEKVTKASLRHVFGALLLLRYFRLLQFEVGQSGKNMASPPPVCLFEAVTQLCSFSKALPMTSELSHVVKLLANECRESMLFLVTMYALPVGSPQLSDFTLWMLKEIPDFAVCHHHFSRVVQSNQTEALGLLEKSGLLSMKSIDLSAVMTCLLPLLDGAGHEDFFYVVIQKVLMGLEERLRHDVHSFTDDDLCLIAALGRRLFELPQQDGAHLRHSFCIFNSRTRCQMEELQVMDGSPWAVVVFSYNSLKEMVRALVRDHRRMKNQVKRQMRTIVGGVAADPLDANKNEVLTEAQQPSTDSFVLAKSSFATSSFEFLKEKGGDGNERVLPLRLSAPLPLRDRFVVFLEDLIKGLVAETDKSQERRRIVNKELFAFVCRHVPIPSIHDEYRRKLFLLVNVFSEENTSKNGDNAEGDTNNDSDDEIPAELRLLVTSLPLSMSSWESVMILREVLSESAGNNPRYTYVLNAAINLQLPISTTRSRIATTLNMWRFLNSQADKLSFADHVRMKQRCFFNLPLSYILSSYWSFITWLFLITIAALNIVGMDFESQYVATRLFREFAPSEDVLFFGSEKWDKGRAKELVSAYLEQGELCAGDGDGQARRQPSSSGALFSSTSYMFLGAQDQRRPMTIITIGGNAECAAVDCTNEAHACASAVLRELSLRLHFPFYLPITQELSMDHIIARVAGRIRRVSFNNAWVVSRVIFRIFPLDRHQTEFALVSHTCAQANLTRRRVTFLLHVRDGVALSPQLLFRLSESVLAQSGNLVIIVHENSLRKGGSTSEVINALTETGSVCCIPYSKQSDVLLSREPASSVFFGRVWQKFADMVATCTAEVVFATTAVERFVFKMTGATSHYFSTWGRAITRFG